MLGVHVHCPPGRCCHQLNSNWYPVLVNLLLCPVVHCVRGSMWHPLGPPRAWMEQSRTFVCMNITFFSSSTMLNYWTECTLENSFSEVCRYCIFCPFGSFLFYRCKNDLCMSSRNGKRGGIPPCWLQHRPTRLPAEATDGHGLGLLGNW